MEINTHDHSPIKLRPYRIPFNNLDDTSSAIKDMLQANIIRPSHSAWSFPIILVNKKLPKEEFLALIECCDGFISLHRSEGFGLCIAEAMLLNVPCIVTNYSGSSDFSTSETAFLVDYDLIEVDKDEYVYAEGLLWAEPSLEDASRQMRIVYQGGDTISETTESAHKNITENFSLEACSKRYLARLEKIGLKIE